MRTTTRRTFLQNDGRLSGAALAVHGGMLGEPEWAAADQVSSPPLVLVQRGTLPLLILAPHGGDEPVLDVPVRTQGVNTQDARTKDLARAIAVFLNAFIWQRTDHLAHTEPAFVPQLVTLPE